LVRTNYEKPSRLRVSYLQNRTPRGASIGVGLRQRRITRRGDASDGHGERGGTCAVAADGGHTLTYLRRRQRDVLLLVNRADHPAIPARGAPIGWRTVATDPDRDARALHRAGHELHIVEGEVRAVVRDRFACQ
jgi:hypothetical protein